MPALPFTETHVHFHDFSHPTLRWDWLLPEAEPDPDLRYDDYLTNDDWLRGFSILSRFDLVFCDDPLVEQMEILAGVCERHPEVTICVDHAGFPRRRDSDYFDEWRVGMTALARQQN